jgi:hypothetical protein
MANALNGSSFSLMLKELVALTANLPTYLPPFFPAYDNSFYYITSLETKQLLPFLTCASRVSYP